MGFKQQVKQVLTKHGALSTLNKVLKVRLLYEHTFDFERISDADFIKWLEDRLSGNETTDSQAWTWLSGCLIGVIG